MFFYYIEQNNSDISTIKLDMEKYNGSSNLNVINKLLLKNNCIDGEYDIIIDDNTFEKFAKEYVFTGVKIIPKQANISSIKPLASVRISKLNNLLFSTIRYMDNNGNQQQSTYMLRTLKDDELKYVNNKNNLYPS